MAARLDTQWLPIIRSVSGAICAQILGPGVETSFGFWAPEPSILNAGGVVLGPTLIFKLSELARGFAGDVAKEQHVHGQLLSIESHLVNKGERNLLLVQHAGAMARQQVHIA